MNTELFRNVVPFVTVMETRSFRAAAASLGVSPAAVSKAVKALEADLGVQLLTRTPRALAPTREGELFFARCQQAVAAVAGARQAVAAARKVPAGELAISAPSVVSTLLAPGLSLLRARHPRVTFKLTITDRLSRLVEESIDIAVRVGPLHDSSLVARRLRATTIVTVASPAYLSARAPLKRLEDLDAHDCLVALGPSGKVRPWRFASGAREVAPTLTVDHLPSLLDAALAGVGVTQMFDFMAAAHLVSGRLTALFTHDAAQGPDVHAVCAPGQRASARTRAAFEAFADAFTASGAGR